MTVLKEHFHLTHDIFSIDPRNAEDAKAYFGREPVHERINERLQLDFASRGVPKFFVHGMYGAGKTHTLAYIRHLLGSAAFSDFPATEAIYTCVPPIKSKDSWLKLHQHLLDEIGRARVKEAVMAIVKNATGDPIDAIRDADVLIHGDTSLQESQAQIFRALIFKGVQETKAWEWLKGAALSPSDAAMLETQTNLTNVPDYVAVLLNLARLVHIGLGKKLVLLMDEAETVGNVQNGDSVDEFRHALRQLADDENTDLGFVIAFQAEAADVKESQIFSYPAVSSRLGYDSAYIDLVDLVYDDTDAKEFIFRVLGHLVDQQAAQDTIDRDGLATEAHAFPFTVDAVDKIVEYVMESPERRSPRQILSIMKAAVAKVWLQGREHGKVVVIDDDMIESIVYPV